MTTALHLKWLIRKFAYATLLLILCALYIPVTHAATANDEINYQGKLFDSGGSPVTDNTYSIQFKLYTAASGGSSIWSETQNVTTDGGLFQVRLGSVTSLSSVDWNQDLYLGITVESDSEMTPRFKIGSVPSAHTLSGALRLTSTLDSYLSGNLGIGTTNPASDLHVQASNAQLRIGGDTDGDTASLLLAETSGAGSETGFEFIYDGDNVSGNKLFLNSYQSGASTTRMTIHRDNGNVGIGTKNPDTALHLSGTSSSPAFLTWERSDGASGSKNWMAGISSNHRWTLGRAGDSGSLTNEYISVLTDGKVGIGTSTPSSLLHVSSGTSGDAEAILEADTDDNDETDNPRLTFKQDGGITRAFLSLEGTTGQTSSSTLENSFLIGSDTSGTPLHFITNNSTRITVATSGDLGVGTTSPTAQLHTTGTVRFQNFGAGTLQTDANGNVSVSSDERLKDIEGNFELGLNELRGIDPIRYRWNATSGMETMTEYAGFSAQNVSKHIEQAVGVDSRGYYTLQDRPILAASVNAIKELDLSLETLASSTAELEDDAGDKTFVGRFFGRLIEWFANTANGIGSFFADSFKARDTVCIGETCLTESQLANLLESETTTTETQDEIQDVDDEPDQSNDSEDDSSDTDTVDDQVGDDTSTTTPEEQPTTDDTSSSTDETIDDRDDENASSTSDSDTSNGGGGSSSDGTEATDESNESGADSTTDTESETDSSEGADTATDTESDTETSGGGADDSTSSDNSGTSESDTSSSDGASATDSSDSSTETDASNDGGDTSTESDSSTDSSSSDSSGGGSDSGSGSSSSDSSSSDSGDSGSSDSGSGSSDTSSSE